MTEDPPYLTVRQTAARLQLSPVTIYRWLTRGELPGVKIGGSWRVSAAALEAMFQPETMSIDAKIRILNAMPLARRDQPWEEIDLADGVP